MPQMDFLYGAHIIAGVYPKADAFATSATTDYVSMENYSGIGFLIMTGDATAGTADGVVTVLAASDVSAAGAGAVPFKYRVCASSTTVDTWGALTDAAAAGFAMTAGDNLMYWIEIDAADIEAVDPGNPFAALKVLEVTNDPVPASIAIFGLGPRYPGAVPVSAIA